ncbi:MAG: hypothetical protein ACE144_18070 [Thermodesulfobacteriota bacterium]
MSLWGTDNASTDPILWQPRGTVNWTPVPNQQPQLHVQYKNSGVATRASFQLPQYVIEYPEVYRWTENGVFQAFVANFEPPPGCVPGGNMDCPGEPDPNSPNPCCRPWTPAFNKKLPLGVVPFSDIQSICWVEKNVCSDLFGVRNETQLYLSYDFLTSSSRNSPVRGKYSFWPPVTNWTYANLPIVIAYLGLYAPDPGTQTTIRVRFDDQDHDLLFLGGDTSPVPIVPLLAQMEGDKVNEKGKVKEKTKTISVENIRAREVEGNLIVQWGGIDLIRPYWQVRVLIGDSFSNETAEISASLTYAGLEVPPPSGTAVLPAASWDKLKAELRSKGKNTAHITIHYRRNYQNNTTGRNELMQVRSQSDVLAYQFE